MKAVCPICQKEIDRKASRYRPFCSERCKRIDLGRWAGGEYRIAAHPEDEEKKQASERSEEEAPPSTHDLNKGGDGRRSS